MTKTNQRDFYKRRNVTIYERENVKNAIIYTYSNFLFDFLTIKTKTTYFELLYLIKKIFNMLFAYFLIIKICSRDNSYNFFANDVNFDFKSIR